MTTDSVLVKRRARHKGEMGLFPDNPMAEDDLQRATEGEEVVCRWYSPRNLEALKFLWALVHKVAENTDRYIDKNEAMDDLKMRAAFSRVVYDDGEIQIRPKSLTRINNEQLRMLTERIEDIVCKEILPGMEKNVLRQEIEEMLGLRK